MLGILFLVGGAAVALVGLSQRDRARAGEAADDYLRSLD